MTSTATAPSRHVRTAAPDSSHFASRRKSMRLTRRGRLLLVVVLAALLFAAFTVGRAASQASEPAGTSADRAPVALATVITVAPGDTLWSVARRIAPERDPRDIVAQLQRLNRLATGGLLAGQLLRLPAVA